MQFGAIALGLGVLVFRCSRWLPGLRATAGAGAGWQAASSAFAARLRRCCWSRRPPALLSAAAAIVLQGAVAGGTGFGPALGADVIGDVLEHPLRPGLGARRVAWLVVGALAGGAAPVPVLQPASVGATGLALPGTGRLVALAVPLAALAALPALGGHASVQEPVALLLPANVLHVLAMSAWLGGIAVLVLRLAGGDRPARAAERTRLLAAVVARFSTLAGLAIAVLLASGIVQSIVELRTRAEPGGHRVRPRDPGEDRLFAGIVALGGVQPPALVPALVRAAREGEPPGRAGLLLRRTLRAEVALGVAALAGDRRAGRLRAVGRRGPGPVLGHGRPRAGADRAHRRPRARRAERDARLSLRPPGRPPVRRDEGADRDRRAAGRQIEPIEFEAPKAGPGHYVVSGAALGVEGDWTVEIAARVTDFDEFRTKLVVPVG